MSAIYRICLALVVIFHSTAALSITLSLDSPCLGELERAGAPGSDHHALMSLAVCLHRNGNATAAFDVYQHLLVTTPHFAYTHVNLAAYYSIGGRPRLAIEQLEKYFDKVGGIYGPPCRAGAIGKADCVNALNNLASVHLSESKNSSIVNLYLTRAIEIGDEFMLTKVYANLGAHLAKVGDENGAAGAYVKAFWISLKQDDLESAVGMLVRRAMLIPTVSASLEDTEQARIQFLQRIRDVTELARVGGSTWVDDQSDLFRVEDGASDPNDIHNIPSLSGKLRRWTDGVQTPHFHVHYKGYYDLPIQQEVYKMFTELCPPELFEVSPHLMTSNNKTTNTKKKVGFISSLIGDDEPHGLLVLDVIRSLSSTNYFDFFVISNGPKAPSSEFYRVTNGNVYATGFDDYKARELLKSLELDCLVYLEAMNDAMMYFLGYQRFAKVQILAMGSPVTSGLPTFDYFVSGDMLEHPFRTQLNADHYSEQVVLFDGQAISFPETQYHPRQDSDLAAGEAKSLSTLSPLDELKLLRRNNVHIYLCFQSIFKIQPLFDHVLADILQADYKGHVVLQASRYSNQTAALQSRIQTVIQERFCGAYTSDCTAMADAYSRVHFVARVTSDKVHDLMQQASVILHPFPFGGSKTASDAINAGIPIVTYPQPYLRGRMAAVFLRVMDLHEVDPDAATCCIASSVLDYVSKAIRLATDESYRTRVRQALQERRNRIFDDKFIALEWGKLLTRALGIKATEEDLVSRMGFQREPYHQDNYFAAKVQEEQFRWRQSVLLSDITASH